MSKEIDAEYLSKLLASFNIESKVLALIKPIINENDYDLYDVIYEKEAKDYYLRIVIDSPKGIDLSDCEKVTNLINDKLDEADYIKDQYFLEVSSPGVERLLRKDEHFEKQIGKKISLKLYQKVDDQKEIVGILEEYNVGKDLIIVSQDKTYNIDLKNIAQAKTVFDW